MPDEVSPDYVRARWAYSELLSWGHGHLYQGPGVQDLKEKLALKVPFDELGKAEHYLLIDQFDRISSERLPGCCVAFLPDLPPRRTTLHNDTAEPGGTR